MVVFFNGTKPIYIRTLLQTRVKQLGSHTKNTRHHFPVNLIQPTNNQRANLLARTQISRYVINTGDSQFDVYSWDFEQVKHTLVIHTLVIQFFLFTPEFGMYYTREGSQLRSRITYNLLATPPRYIHVALFCTTLVGQRPLFFFSFSVDSMLLYTFGLLMVKFTLLQAKL